MTVTSTSSSPSATMTTSSAAQSPTTTDGQQPEQSSGGGGGGGGLSVSDKIAIGIGVPVGLATMLGTWISWKLYSSRKKGRGYR